jgi:polysaccharide biosynthesis protein PslH
MNNFLSVVWYKVLPPQYGGQKGIAHFNDCLAKKVILTCLCSRNNMVNEPLSYKVINTLPASKLQFWNPFVRKQVLEFIRKRSFTHIIIEHPWHGWIGHYKEKLGFKFIVHAHNIEHLRIKSKNRLGWRLLRRTEKMAFGLADHVLFKTEKDKETAISLFRVPEKNCVIVPYGIMEKEEPFINSGLKEQLRKKHAIRTEEKLILFAGTPGYQPNARAIETITDQIIPLLQKKDFRFRLIICGGLSGKKMIALNEETSVEAVGFVSSIRDYLRCADVFINPVLSGSGIQTKSIEAIANGCSVVSTAFAATGLPGYLHQKKVFISADNDWDSFTDNIIFAASQVSATPKQFYEDYNWQNIIDRLLPGIDGSGIG